MRKIKLFIAQSLDGFIARADGQVDWLFTDDDYGYHEFYASIDTTLMGRRTYEELAAFGGDFPYPEKTNFVLTRNPELTNNSDVTFISVDAVTFVNKLKAQEGGDIWLIGGGQLNAGLLNAGLIDEMILSVHPIILGEGIPLFAHGTGEAHFQLLGGQVFPSGLVQFTYQYQADA